MILFYFSIHCFSLVTKASSLFVLLSRSCTPSSILTSLGVMELKELRLVVGDQGQDWACRYLQMLTEFGYSPDILKRKKKNK